MTFEDLLQVYGPVAPVVFGLAWAYVQERRRNDKLSDRLYELGKETVGSMKDLAAEFRGGSRS